MWYVYTGARYVGAYSLDEASSVLENVRRVVQASATWIVTPSGDVVVSINTQDTEAKNGSKETSRQQYPVCAR